MNHSTRKLKICFNNEIHRVPHPTSLQHLNELVIMCFNRQLPQQWSLRYKDSEEDLVMLSQEQDFHGLMSELNKNCSSSKTTKIFVKAEEEDKFQLHVQANEMTAQDVAGEHGEEDNHGFEVIDDEEIQSFDQGNQKAENRIDACDTSGKLKLNEGHPAEENEHSDYLKEEQNSFDYLEVSRYKVTQLSFYFPLAETEELVNFVEAQPKDMSIDEMVDKWAWTLENFPCLKGAKM